MKLNRYTVVGQVSDRGRIHHQIRAANPTAAWLRFERAYSKHTCTLVETKCEETWK